MQQGIFKVKYQKLYNKDLMWNIIF